MHYFVEIVGWSGAVLILAAYALLSLGKLHGRSALYQWMNVVGSAGFVVNSRVPHPCRVLCDRVGILNPPPY